MTRYRTIVADPPWPMPETGKTTRGEASCDSVPEDGGCPIRKLAVTLAMFAALLIVMDARTANRDQKAVEAIRYVFGSYASQALRVAYCESRYSIWARNGQYLGLFQMGEYARARYGHAWNAWAQAISAWRYFAASGYDWSPWSCKP